MSKKSKRFRARKPKVPSRITEVGITWYTEEQWRLVKASAVDSERFENTYAEWVSMVEDALRDIVTAGVLPVRVSVDAAELHAFCFERGLTNNAAARVQFVNHVLQRDRERKLSEAGLLDVNGGPLV